MSEITEKQKNLMKHALGLTRSDTIFRNHFCASDGCPDLSDWKDLESKGFAWSRPAPFCSDTLFHVSDKGKELFS